jgi:hypothetical protein
MSRSDFPIWALAVVAIGLVALLMAVVTTGWWVAAVIRRTRRRADATERRLRAESDNDPF